MMNAYTTLNAAASKREMSDVPPAPLSLLPARTQKGFSLIELMISMAVGLLIIAGVSNMFGGVLRGDSDMLNSMRLNSDLTSAMTLMTTEIRRAGFCMGPDCWPTDPSTGYTDAMINLVDSDADGNADCILYSYDRNDNGTIDADERGGFELRDGNLRMRRSCNADPADVAQINTCSRVCDNDLDDWEAMLDASADAGDFTVTELTMTTDGSRCLHSGTQSYWYVKEGAQSIEAPCRHWIRDPTDDGDGDLAIYLLDDLDIPTDGYQDESSTFNKVLTGSTGLAFDWNLADGMWQDTSTDTDVDEKIGNEREFNGTLEARQINITLTATIPTSDGSNYTKTLSSSVKVRNEQVNTRCPTTADDVCP
jgi:prepilin-type N-terminal cleavage/methylation domain-containing protein